ncbi:endolytic transglycosylase MltG [Blastococcus sp. TBT05-19]|uniref:endolytic transglycosylase MltG n=1 Tax=Blastococcus sp. TBT05-19 TaxID=2250581 RepID=UPI000DEB1796|nr:endolytic transglycosylase MltG [Blastococcus sp. TBT05-19]RBY89057.1 endolytic transglycosylase MltG [Blastococcus sp. TBT05-19]
MWTGPGTPTGGSYPPGSPVRPPRPADRGGVRPGSGLIDRGADATGPLVEPDWWAYGSTDHPDHPQTGRPDPHGFGRQHPSGPLPPMPTGIWDRMAQGSAGSGDDPTVATPRVGGRPGDAAPDDLPDAHPASWEEETGALDVIGANVDEESPRRRGLRRSRRTGPAVEHPATVALPEQQPEAQQDHDRHEDLFPGEDELAGETDGPLTDDEIPVAPYDPRTDRARRRRRRRPFAVLLALLVLGAIVAGIVLGGQRLLGLLDPTAQDYSGAGTGSVDIRVNSGDTLSDIARTLDEADVVASTGPFVSAAKDNPDATGIQPGVYTLRLQMSGASALDLLLDPASRQVSRVTLREGLTVVQVLARLAGDTGTPLEELQAAAGDPAAIGLPPYADGKLEGFLFPATYDFEPGDTAVDMLSAMVARAEQAFDGLGVPEAERLTWITKASIVQAEAAGAEDMAKVARVLENRLADGMPLQLDTTVNYANGKGGITTTAADRANPSEYNTYVHTGLPPGAISNPGEDALRAVLAPAEGDWRFFVVVDPDTGDTRFAATKAEHDRNVLLFRQWLAENPEG